jgi:hypothetical protein
VVVSKAFALRARAETPMLNSMILVILKVFGIVSFLPLIARAARAAPR